MSKRVVPIDESVFAVAGAVTRPAHLASRRRLQPRSRATFYSLLDADVTPPSLWNRPFYLGRSGPLHRTGVFSGTLDLVVNETGSVESVSVVETVWPPYDAALLQAAKNWRYQPALKDGKPVKFRQTLAINVDPRKR